MSASIIYNLHTGVFRWKENCVKRCIQEIVNWGNDPVRSSAYILNIIICCDLQVSGPHPAQLNEILGTGFGESVPPPSPQRVLQPAQPGLLETIALNQRIPGVGFLSVSPAAK